MNPEESWAYFSIGVFGVNHISLENESYRLIQKIGDDNSLISESLFTVERIIIRTSMTQWFEQNPCQ